MTRRLRLSSAGLGGARSTRRWSSSAARDRRAFLLCQTPRPRQRPGGSLHALRSLPGSARRAFFPRRAGWPPTFASCNRTPTGRPRRWSSCAGASPCPDRPSHQTKPFFCLGATPRGGGPSSPASDGRSPVSSPPTSGRVCSKPRRRCSTPHPLCPRRPPCNQSPSLARPRSSQQWPSARALGLGPPCRGKRIPRRTPTASPTCSGSRDPRSTGLRAPCSVSPFPSSIFRTTSRRKRAWCLLCSRQRQLSFPERLQRSPQTRRSSRSRFRPRPAPSSTRLPGRPSRSGRRT
mmetsp:Transcript_8724/g.24903  ORF Transcript_8724/g.24903 Transcript_8724/m.24903 type:complete len:291 (-) Transcript_8724:684-1556(-)